MGTGLFLVSIGYFAVIVCGCTFVKVLVVNTRL